MEEEVLFPPNIMGNMVKKGISVIEDYKRQKLLLEQSRDLEYFKQKLFESLRVPKEYLGQ